MKKNIPFFALIFFGIALIFLKEKSFEVLNQKYSPQYVFIAVAMITISVAILIWKLPKLEDRELLINYFKRVTKKINRVIQEEDTEVIKKEKLRECEALFSKGEPHDILKIITILNAFCKKQKKTCKDLKILESEINPLIISHNGNFINDIEMQKYTRYKAKLFDIIHSILG